MTEMLASLAIAAIGVGMAVPNLSAVTVKNRLVAEANDFISIMRLARTEAIKRGVTVNLSAVKSDTADAEWTGGSRVWIDVDRNGIYEADNDELIRDTDALPAPLRLDSDADRLDISFDASGNSNVNEIFHLCRDGGREIGRTIQLTQSGHVAVREYHCGAS